MSRYRPPPAPKPPYITQAGYKALQKELNQLWKVDRPKITNVVHEAAKNGDRSENGDYIYGKQKLREIDRRITYLSKRLDEVQVVDQLPRDQNKVFFGAKVTLQDENDQLLTVKLVGVDEIDPKKGAISISSPLAKKLLGKNIDDDVSISITTENSKTNNYYQIINIEYGQ